MQLYLRLPVGCELGISSAVVRAPPLNNAVGADVSDAARLRADMLRADKLPVGHFRRGVP